MGTSRRLFIISLASALVNKPAIAEKNARIFFCASSKHANYVLASSSDFHQIWRTFIPYRGHGLAYSDFRILVVGRRPSDWAFILDQFTGNVLTHLAPPKNFIFTGHVASNKSNWFLGCQSKRRSLGFIARYSVDGELIDFFSSGGIEPHEIVVGGEFLYIANGGRVTSPDLPRVVLNPNSVFSDLVKIRISNSQIVNKISFMKNLSARHLDFSKHGIVVGCQWSGIPKYSPPLVWHLSENELNPLPAPTNSGFQSIQGYIGSITWWEGKIIATAPRGNQYWVLDPVTKYSIAVPEDDVCGVTVLDGKFCFSSGFGILGDIDKRIKVDFKIDNHLLSV